MSTDSHTDITTQSYGNRLGGALKGILTGFVIFLIAFPLLFWNEGRAVKRHRTLAEGVDAVISVPSDTVAPQNERKLIHTTGLATTQEVLSDKVFGVSVQGLQLVREVSMYQWREKKEKTSKKNVGGSTTTETTYTYTKEWSDSLIDSRSFQYQEGHANPHSIPYQSQQIVAQSASLGAFRLPPDLVKKINNFESVPVSTKTLPDDLAGRAQPFGSGFYLGEDTSSPQIGDIKVSFRIVPQTTVSVIGKQAKNSFAPYVTREGGHILLLETGLHGADKMFQNAQRANTILTWILRLAGFLIMTVGLATILKPLSVFADILPAFGNPVGTVTGAVAAVIAAVCSLVTIATAWIFYRPILGLTLLGLGATCLIGFKFIPKHSVTATTPPPPPTSMGQPPQI